MRLPKTLCGVFSAALIGWIAVAPREANAQDDKAKAALLAREADDLLAAGKVAEACDKLNDSVLLESISRTLLELAQGREKEGRIGTAYVVYERAEKVANDEIQKGRAATAKAKRNALYLRLARVTVNVPKEAI